MPEITGMFLLLSLDQSVPVPSPDALFSARSPEHCYPRLEERKNLFGILYGRHVMSL